MSVAPVEIEAPDDARQLDEDVDRPWICLVWNDPINLMSYVTYVFLTYFKYSREKAELLMLDVHQKGRAVVSSGTREEMERDVNAIH
jgi:ATP-dependent Clp protease adaptor protein ClpS